MHFAPFQQAVAKQFARLMATGQMFRTNTEKDHLWDLYLGSFPAGTNPLYRERTEHDCSCCRSFVKSVGNAVAIIDGKLETVWDIKPEGVDPAYVVVATALSVYVAAQPIKDVFLHDQKSVGAVKSFEETLNGTKTWEHFHVNLLSTFVANGADIPTKLGKSRDLVAVFKRGLDEITPEAVDTVLDLIAQGTLYRGAEFKGLVEAFSNELSVYHTCTVAEQAKFVWVRGTKISPATASIRNSAIGTLLQDLSAGMDLEQAVRRWESVMAPANYKRPTALVTPKMVEQAKAKLNELGLLSALERRYARLTDITVNNILFADRNAKKVMNGDVFDDLIAETGAKAKKLDKVEEISIEKFLRDVLPTAKSIEVLLENRHQANLVSLVAPVDPTAGALFKWDNNFSWSYHGGLADSELRKAVAARGGRVDGVFRFSHTWNYGKRNASLMDLHVFMPGNNIGTDNPINELYGSGRRVGWNQRQDRMSGGVQDVDYTKAAPEGYVPVENITFPDLARMPEGRYVCKIHNWNLRQPTQGGFRAEIEFAGQVFQYEYDKPLKHHEWITVAEVVLKNGQFTITHHLPTTTSSQMMYALPSQTFHKVNVLLQSPNHWDGHGVGNKHYFFMLDGAKAEQPARGFYNEFLKEELNAHRKVFEIVGSKMKVADSPDQLSGLGFSSTQKASVIVRVAGSFTRTLQINF